MVMFDISQAEPVYPGYADPAFKGGALAYVRDWINERGSDVGRSTIVVVDIEAVGRGSGYSGDFDFSLNETGFTRYRVRSEPRGWSRRTYCEWWVAVDGQGRMVAADKVTVCEVPALW